MTALAEKLADIMIQKADNRWKDFIDADIYIDQDAELESAYEQEMNVYLPDDLYAELKRHKAIIEGFQQMEEIIRDHATDRLEYHTNRLNYYGLKQSDFI